MIALDIVVSTLLALTIFYSWRLNRNISVLKASKEEMAKSIIEFSEALKIAEDSVARLKNLNIEVGGQLQDNISKARFLSNDLAFLIQKGNEIADKVEGNISLGRSSERLNIRPAYTESGKGSLVKTGEFNNRAAKIAEGQISSVYNNIVESENITMNTKGLAQRYAMEQALDQLAKKNLARAKQETQEKRENAENEKGSKQRRLFDALKWGKQLNG